MNENQVEIGANLSELLPATVVEAVTTQTAVIEPQTVMVTEHDLEEDQFTMAINHIKRANRAASMTLQHRMHVSASVAQALLEGLESRGIVGPAKEDGSARDILPLINDPDIATAITELLARTVLEPVVAPVAPPKPVLVVKPSKPQLPVTKQKLFIVGLYIDPEAPGLLTADAEGLCTGYVMYGPDSSMSGLLPYERFISRLRMDKITLRQRFNYNRNTGRVYRGALMYDIMGKHTCMTCKHSFFDLSFNKLDELRRMQGVQNGAPYCQSCLNALNATMKSSDPLYAAKKEAMRLRWKAEDAKHIGAGDVRARQLYAAYMQYIDNPSGETVSILPRVWAVYPANATPGDWVPTDPVAAAIETAEQTQGLTIRPFSMVNRDNAGALLALRMEATRDHEGKAGMTIGWLSSDNLTSTHACDYTIQLVPNYRLGNPAQARYRTGKHSRAGVA